VQGRSPPRVESSTHGNQVGQDLVNIKHAFTQQQTPTDAMSSPRPPAEISGLDSCLHVARRSDLLKFDVLDCFYLHTP
jgi:hypothetical protein